jgi:hypothetical protein
MAKSTSTERAAKETAANRDDARPKHEIISDARAGQPGKLTVPYTSADPEERRAEIDREIESHTLAGLSIKVLLNPQDALAQPLPAPRSGLLAVEPNREVPPGEFHLELAPAG